MSSDQPTETDSAVRWRLVYAAVVVFTAAFVAFLYLFSRWYAG